MRHKPILGIVPFSNLWHAIWTTMAALGSSAVWIFVDDNRPSDPYANTSYVTDFIYLAPVGAFLFGGLAITLWIVWWNERSSRLN